MITFNKWSLKTKLIIVIWGVAISALFTGFLYVVYQEAQFNKDDLIHELRLSASLTGESSAAALYFEEKEGVENVLKKLKNVPNLIQGTVYDSSGTKFANFDLRSATSPPEKINGDFNLQFTDSSLILIQPLLYNNTELGTVRLVASTDVLKIKIKKYLSILLLLMLALMIISYFLARWFAGIIAKPVLKLTKVTKEISEKGDYSTRVKKKTSDEIGSLYDGFNSMLSTIQSREAERNLALQALEQSEQKYRSFIENSNDAIYLLYNGRFEIVNDRFIELFELTREEIQSKEFRFKDLIHPDSYAEIEERETRIAGGEEVDSRYEFVGRTKSDKRINLEVNVSYIPYKKGRAVQGFLRDITERRTLEEQLRQAQKMEAIGRLSGGVAHDFNNLLTIILGYSELAKTKIEPRHPVLKNIEQITKAGQRAEALTRQLLAFSRRQVIQPVSFDVNQLILDLEKMLRRLIGENIELVVLLKEDKGVIKADPGQMEQIIMNLSVNAKDAMPDGGRLIIETQAVSLDKEQKFGLDELEVGEYIRISVRDSGIGMEKELLSHIFEPFFTTKERGKGTGLGLSTVYGIVQQNNGFIKVSSELGDGTVFDIFFPRQESVTEFVVEKEIDDDKLYGSERILLVEDVPGLRHLAASTVTERGYKVTTAANGEEALSLFKKFNGMFDLLLTDIIMPGINGKKLAEKLSKQSPKLKIIFMSGYTDDAILPQTIADENIVFIQKPFTPIQLLWKIRKTLDG